MSDPAAEAGSWFVYVLVSASRRATYVGVSTDVERRLAQHNGAQPGGASSTRSGRPWRVGAVCGPLATRSTALQLEHRIKRCNGPERLAAARAYAGVDRG